MPTSFTITGTITPASAGAGARITLGEMGDVFADSNGNYTLNNVPNGTFTVIPFKAGFTFSPTWSARRDASTARNATGVNFTATPSGLWSSSFDLGLVAVNMVMMHTGKVLMYSGSFTTSATSACGIRRRAAAPSCPIPYYNLFCSGHSQLADGRILVVGGYAPPNLGAANANIFDPVTLSWSALPNMAYRRWYPTLDDAARRPCPDHLRCADVSDVPGRRPRDLRSGHEPVHDAADGTALAFPYYPFMFVLPDGTVINAGANEDTDRNRDARPDDRHVDHR